MSKTTVVLLAPTKGKKAGEKIQVDAETADALVANRNAVRAADASPKQSAKD
jgi:hypothetical protein